VAGLGLFALRHARPQARYALACLALLACIVWPAAGLIARLAAAAPATVDATLFAPRIAGAAAPAALPLAWLNAHLGAFVLAWAACAAALSLRMGLGLWWIARAAGSDACDPAWQAGLDALARQFGIRRALRLRIADRLASPMTAGFWRPVVLLPASVLSGMPPELIEALLAHELGHILRADYLVNLGQNLVETLLFYHPAVWWLSHCIRQERELIADELAAQHVGQRRLALALSELEKCQFFRQQLALAANGGDLMSRITRLLRPDTRRLHWKSAAPVLCLAVALVAGCAQLGTASKPSAPVHTPAVADFKSCVKPMYPKQSLRDENTGTVVLGFLVDEQGKVIDSTVRKSSGFLPLDETARTAIGKCSFKPATTDGKPVQEWMQMQYVWTLK
jgi:D-alanyl-D-alanine endopeptidase (penicillin-binding protein 7)